MTTDIAALVRDMRDLADRIIECQGENSDGEEIINLYDESDTTFKAQNVLLVLNALQAAEARVKELTSEQEPVAWTDAEELRDVEKHGCGYLFKIDPANPYTDPRRQIMVYRRQPKPVVVLPARFKPELSKVELFKGAPVMKLDVTGGWLNRASVVSVLEAAGIVVKDGE